VVSEIIGWLTAAQKGNKQVLDVESFTQQTVSFCNSIHSVGKVPNRLLHEVECLTGIIAQKFYSEKETAHFSPA
jgi:hypothetical protein